VDQNYILVVRKPREDVFYVFVLSNKAAILRIFKQNILMSLFCVPETIKYDYFYKSRNVNSEKYIMLPYEFLQI